MRISVEPGYVSLADGSQDLGAGDTDGDVGDACSESSLEIRPRERLRLDAAATSGPAWWCMEETPYTARTQPCARIGPCLPHVWDGMSANPVMLAARDANDLGPFAGGRRRHRDRARARRGRPSGSVGDVTPDASGDSTFAGAHPFVHCRDEFP